MNIETPSRSGAPPLRSPDGGERCPKFFGALLLRQIGLFDDSAAGGVSVGFCHGLERERSYGLIGLDDFCNHTSGR